MTNYTTQGLFIRTNRQFIVIDVIGSDSTNRKCRRDPILGPYRGVDYDRDWINMGAAGRSDL